MSFRMAGIAMAMALVGCSDRPKPVAKPDASDRPQPLARLGAFRVIKFAGERVVVPFREGLTTATVSDPVVGGLPGVGDPVVLGDLGKGEVFVALDLEALKFYHSEPGADQLERFRLLGDEGRLFVVPRGAVGSVARVVEGELPQGLKAVELKLDGPKGGMAWVGEPFVRRVTATPG